MAEGRLFLTRVDLDTRQRSVRTAAADPRQLHRCLMKAMPDGLAGPARQTAHLLYRVEASGRAVLAQSAIPPDHILLPSGFNARTIEITPLLDRLAESEVVRYECVATPIKRERASGREVALRGRDARAWWAAKAEVAGLELAVDDADDPAVLMDQRTQVVRGWRTIGYMSFSGFGSITDVARLRASLVGGIGRNKNWGAGLLTLAPAA